MKVDQRAAALGIELAVVVLGVLIALAADSWWEDRADAARAQTYLTSIESDMAVTEQTLEVAASYWEESADDVRRFLRAMEEPSAALDSGAGPFSVLSDDGGSRRAYLASGTLDALLSTGDINLLAPSIRSVIVRENASLRLRYEQIQQFSALLGGSVYRDLDLPRQQLVVAGEIPGNFDALSAPVIARSPRMRHGWAQLLNVFANQAEEARAMLESVRAIRASVAGS